jgi:hypothetical protein
MIFHLLLIDQMTERPDDSSSLAIRQSALALFALRSRDFA